MSVFTLHSLYIMEITNKLKKIKIKPLSINEAYRGRRFKTKSLEVYKESLKYLLPKMSVTEGKLSVTYVFGVSSKGSDGDNLIKAFQDCVAEQYGFNDNKIYEWYVKKTDVEKGEEFVEFDIKAYSG